MIFDVCQSLAGSLHGLLLAQNEASSLRFFPESASTLAPHTDALFWTLVLICSAVAIGIAIFLVYFLIRYRASSSADRSTPPGTILWVELTWMIIPLMIFIIIFLWSAGLYFFMKRPPKGNALDVYVVGKQWMWKFQHPTGQREIDELHVPVNKTVRLMITSEDVIHSLFIPDFRVKQDAVPGRYTSSWFTGTKPGKYHIFCAEYCGLNHSYMGGWIFVMSPEDYANWLQKNTVAESMSSAGAKLFMRMGCSGCHLSGGKLAPALNDLYGNMVVLADNSRTIANYQYIRDSILLPQKQIVAGYSAIMPTFAGLLKEQELTQLIEYIKSLSADQKGRLNERSY